jgi:hypothetical protein
MQKTIELSTAIGMVVLLLTTGCGTQQQGPELGVVRGVVTLDGTPLSNVVVTYSPVAKGGSSSAETGQDGSYSLQYSASSFGAVPGEHVVTVRRANAGGGGGGNAAELGNEEPPEDENYTEDFDTDADGNFLGDEPRANATAKSGGVSIPTIYTNQKTSPLRVTVKSGTNEIPVELKSE